MGMERSVAFAGPAPKWDAIKQHISEAGLSVQLRMIDGQPAFPDEVPEEGWRELRISAPSGMMTLRLHSQSLSVVVWGNADAALQHEWETVLHACESAVKGPESEP